VSYTVANTSGSVFVCQMSNESSDTGAHTTPRGNKRGRRADPDSEFL